MRVDSVKLLRAPVTAAKLELEAFDTVGDDVISGRLIDRNTGVWYRIDEGIADLVPGEYRNAARYDTFCRKHGLLQGPIPPHSGLRDENTVKQISFFSEHGEAYETEVVTSPFYEIFDRVTVGRWIGRSISENMFVVEVGCGSGRQTIPLLRAGANVLAVDLSEDLLRSARRKILSESFCGYADFVAGTAENLPLMDLAFDAGLIFGSLHHFSNPPVALLAMARVIKPDGRFYLMEPHKSPVRFIFDWTMRHWNLWKEEANDDPLFTRTKFRTWLSAGGFESRISYSTYLPPHLFYLINGRSGERLLATTDAIFNSVPGLRRLGGVIIAQGTKRA